MFHNSSRGECGRGVNLCGFKPKSWVGGKYFTESGKIAGCLLILTELYCFFFRVALVPAALWLHVQQHGLVATAQTHLCIEYHSSREGNQSPTPPPHFLEMVLFKIRWNSLVFITVRHTRWQWFFLSPEETKKGGVFCSNWPLSLYFSRDRVIWNHFNLKSKPWHTKGL